MQAAKDILRAYAAVSAVLSLFSIPAALVVFGGATFLAAAAYTSERW